MEHRWGPRVAVRIPIRLRPLNSRIVSIARLTNLSLSGGFIADFDFRVLKRIQVIPELPVRSKQECQALPAYVVRACDEGIGIEWCEFSPRTVVELMQAAKIAPYRCDFDEGDRWPEKPRIRYRR